jgi:hypothetical protein
MHKLLFVVALVSLATGCSTQTTKSGVNLTEAVCPVSLYDVTVDSWCGNGCANYPVSHKVRDTRPENNRVDLNGTQRTDLCANK